MTVAGPAAVLEPKRFETILLAGCFAAWLVGLLALFGVIDWNVTVALGLYPYYSVAAAAGWLLGNVYVHRSRSYRQSSPGGTQQPTASDAFDRARGRFLFMLYLFGPPGWLYMLRSMAPEEMQRLAPLVPIFSMGVYAALFSVPVWLSRSTPQRRRLRIGSLSGSAEDSDR